MGTNQDGSHRKGTDQMLLTLHQLNDDDDLELKTLGCKVLGHRGLWMLAMPDQLKLNVNVLEDSSIEGCGRRNESMMMSWDRAYHRHSG